MVLKQNVSRKVKFRQKWKLWRLREIERDRERQREIERDRDRQRQIEIDRERQRHRETDRETERDRVKGERKVD